MCRHNINGLTVLLHVIQPELDSPPPIRRIPSGFKGDGMLKILLYFYIIYESGVLENGKPFFPNRKIVTLLSFGKCFPSLIRKIKIHLLPRRNLAISMSICLSTGRPMP